MELRNDNSFGGWSRGGWKEESDYRGDMSYIFLGFIYYFKKFSFYFKDNGSR